MNIELGYGLVTCQRHPDQDQGWGPLYAEALELAELTEEYGLASIWVSEHHFVGDGHLPSLLPMLAAMAARTSRIKVGTALLLAPLYDPLRLIEDAHVVDQLSNGRLILGLGLGWRDEEFEALGVPQSQRVRRLTDFIEMARQSSRDGLVSLSDGRARPFVTPSAVSPSGVPLWIGALAEPAIRRAGRISDGFMATEVTPAELAEQVGWARQEHRAAGRKDELTISLHLPTLCSLDGVDWESARDSLAYPNWKYEDMYAARSDSEPLRRPEPMNTQEDARLRETSIIGTPAEVADRIREYTHAAGGRLHMIARSYLPSLNNAERAAALRALGEVNRLLGS
jgi:alkanesulfonate monooxygenase SsuD/methylene tetrahydromethanopterin reductase-like flavin-dependent oxidoreductase (luciferase family)